MAMLHALWDASGSVAYWLTLLLTGTPMQWTLVGQGAVPVATQTQVHLYTAVNWALLLLDAVVGVAILVVRWRRATAVRPHPVPVGAGPAEPGESPSPAFERATTASPGI